MKIAVKQLPGTGLEKLGVLKWSDHINIVWLPF